MNFQQAIDYIHRIGRFGRKPGLTRINAILEALGHPERGLRIIHVAGTNGKGSTASLISGMLEANDYQVGLFTSPYLESFCERIMINHEKIAEADVARLVTKVKPICEALVEQEVIEQPTQFEIITAVALAYYAQQKVDFVVLEVGLGGRFDATNIVVPEICVITTIGMDHQAILGNTLAQIAFEKAGIIKDGVPVITGVREHTALSVIKRQAKACKSSLFAIDQDFSAERLTSRLDGQTFRYQGREQRLEQVKIGLLGAHQVDNAAVAIAVVEYLQNQGLRINQSALLQGAAQVQWPGRFEIVHTSPYIVLDGAHNAHGTQALKHTVQELLSGKKIIGVIGILADKDYASMLADILPLLARVIITAPEYSRAASLEELANEARKYIQHVDCLLPISHALDQAQAWVSDDNDVILVTGSLYTIGEARSYLLNN